MNTFFITGVQRSGTTLLAVLLSKHPDVILERKSIVFRIITCFRSLYDILPYNFEVNEKQFLSWLLANDSKGQLAQLINPAFLKPGQSITELIQTSIDKKLQREGKKLWGDKAPHLQYYHNDVRLMMPEARIIHIIRDGRAVAYSMSNRSSRHLSLSAQAWLDGNTKALINQQIVGAEKYKIIQYEELLAEPERIMKEICVFLSLPYDPAIINPDEAGVSESEKYVKSTFDTSKINKWKTQLTAKQLKKVERIQGPLLRKLGYELQVKDLNYKPLSVWAQLFYKLIDNFKSLFQSKRIGMVDRKNVEINIPIKNRVYSFFKVIAHNTLAPPLFKSLFPRVYYRKRKYDENEFHSPRKK